MSIKANTITNDSLTLLFCRNTVELLQLFCSHGRTILVTILLLQNFISCDIYESLSKVKYNLTITVS